MKRRAHLLMSGVLAFGLFLGGGAMAKQTSSGTPSHEEVRVEMLGSKLGTITQVSCQALADIVNKNHPWIRINVTETMGTTNAIKTFSNLSSDKKKNMFCVGDDLSFTLARGGKAPFDKPREDMRFVANMLKLSTWPVTLNKNIRTKADIPGTKWAVGPRGSGIAFQAEFLLWDVWDLKDKVDLKYLSWTAGKDALVAHLVDVCLAGSIPFGKPLGSKVKGNPAADELVTTQPVHFIEITKEDWDRGIAKRKKEGRPIPWAYLPMKAGALGKGLPPVDTGSISGINAWFASTDTDEEVIYGITKTILEKYPSFKEYHKATGQMSLEGFSDAPFITEADVHPGALRAYKEFGVKIGAD